MLRFNQIIIIVLLLKTFGFSALAQNPSRTPYEGSVHSYTCNGISVGAEFSFYITPTGNGSIILEDDLTDDFDFLNPKTGTVGNDGLASTEVLWNIGSSAQAYALWLDVALNGCSNKIFIGISPKPNNRTIEFDVTASTECFNLDGNGFETTFTVLDNNSTPLPEIYYPLNVNFTVNGEPYSQTVNTNDRVLQIENNWFTENPEENTEVVVDLTEVTDKYNTRIKTGTNGSYTRTIFAIPQIEFTEAIRRRYYKNEETTAYIIYSDTGSTTGVEPKQAYPGDR